MKKLIASLLLIIVLAVAIVPASVLATDGIHCRWIHTPIIGTPVMICYRV